MRIFRRIAHSLTVDFQGPAPAEVEAQDARAAAAAILCLRDTGFNAEAAAYEEAWLNAEEIDDLAQIGLPFSADEFAEKYLVPWMEAGGEQTERHAALQQNLMERRSARTQR